MSYTNTTRFGLYDPGGQEGAYLIVVLQGNDVINTARSLSCAYTVQAAVCLKKIPFYF